MSKYILFFIFALALLLSACSGNETSTQPQEPPNDTVGEVVGSSPVAPPTATANQTVITGDGEPMACNVVSLLPPLDPTQQAIFPAVSDQDWIEGPDGAQVTIVEYSDFQ
jgi:hypothetical protein